MLNIFLHFGPHKTGTTSIQQYLRRTIGSDAPKVNWYPETSGASPGHVDIFKDLSGRNPQYRGLLEEYVDLAKSNNVDNLIISQEDFCTSDPKVFKNIRTICSGLKLHLILTHRSIRDRTVSQWQERIKHGGRHPIDDLGPSLSSKRFSTTLTQDIASHLLPDQISIVTSSPQEPNDKLIQRFIDCLDIEEYINNFGNEIDPDVRINTSHGRIETEFIRHLNIMSQYLDDIAIEHDYEFMRRQLVQTMLSKRWKDRCEKVAIKLPSNLECQVAAIAKDTYDNLFSEFHKGNIAVFGNLNHLLD